MSRTVHVDLGERSYDIHIGLEPAIGRAIPESASSALIISDSNVDPLYGDGCEQQLAARGLRVTRAVVPAGEASKDLAVVRGLYDRCFEAALDRRSVILALGGGVVGDLGGFVAATFLRGVPYLQVPTSLLAMVDSSVGGKTGVNVPQGKNLIGAFYQPIEVVAGLSSLSTLADREYRSGLAEVVKYGVIWDAGLFARLENSVAGLLAREPSLLEDVVARCCEIKAEVVARDERESGLRAILNFGHTLAHAIENVAGYGEFLHGEAVSIGTVYAARLSTVQRGLSAEDAGRVVRLLARLGLPVAMPAVSSEWNRLRAAMSSDKKAVAGVPKFVLAESIGRVAFGCEVEEDALSGALDEVVGAGVGMPDEGGR
jgi:3-dehydroquinate synthase